MKPNLQNTDVFCTFEIRRTKSVFWPNHKQHFCNLLLEEKQVVRALNRSLLFKWVWRFCTQQSALWTKIIKGIHGEDGKIGKHVRSHHPSLWLDIVKEVHHIQRQGTDLMGFIHRKMGNGVDIRFWEDKWRGDNTFQSDFPRMYALETQKNISVALKLSHDDLLCSFRRAPRAGAEELQYIQLVKIMEGITLFDSKDRWRWSLEGCGEFTVASVRNLLDANSLPVVSSKTRWIKAVPIKVNIHAWKVKLDILPTRLNISKRGMDIEVRFYVLYAKRMWNHLAIFSLLALYLERYFARFCFGGRLMS
ncbi:hypothetical protein Tco_0812421 [Tanacetum coccineum]